MNARGSLVLLHPPPIQGDRLKRNHYLITTVLIVNLLQFVFYQKNTVVICSVIIHTCV